MIGVLLYNPVEESTASDIGLVRDRHRPKIIKQKDKYYKAMDKRDYTTAIKLGKEFIKMYKEYRQDAIDVEETKWERFKNTARNISEPEQKFTDSRKPGERIKAEIDIAKNKATDREKRAIIRMCDSSIYSIEQQIASMEKQLKKNGKK